MTDAEITKTVADLNLSTADRLGMLTCLMLDLGQPKLEGLPAGTRVIGTAKWTDEEVMGLQRAFGVLMNRLRTVPIHHARPVLDFIETQLEPFRGNKA